MLASLVPRLICPNCRSSIRIESVSDGSVDAMVAGKLACAGCDAIFPVERGIARMMPKSILDAQKDEIQARDAQVAQYDANSFLNFFGRFEIPMTLARLDLGATNLLLEGGCGTGRMTPTFAARVREQVSIDFSFESLCAAKLKADKAGLRNVHFVQADLCNLPLADSLFDRVVSCQVLEHVPGGEARDQAVRSLGRVAGPGARVVVSAYRHSALMGAKQGRHAGGIPFFRFTRREFADLLGAEFEIESLTGSLIYLWLAKGFRRG
jgi:SAM-dependent methyltransferase